MNLEIMSLTHFLLLTVLDFVGVYFNMRMLAYCFKDKTKYKFLQKCRGLSIFQSACQFVIVITGAVDSWRIFNDRSYNPGQPYNVVKLFSISFTFVQACNLTAILCIDSEHPLVTFRHQDRCSKLKIAAAVTLGLIGSSMIWWFSCFPHYYISVTVFITVRFIFIALFIILLLAAGFKYLKDDFEDTTSKVFIDCEVLWNICKENKRPTLFIATLLLCLVMVLSGFLLDREKHALMVTNFEIIYDFIMRFVVGIILPVTFSDLIEKSSFDDEEAVETMIV